LCALLRGIVFYVRGGAHSRSFTRAFLALALRASFQLLRPLPAAFIFCLPKRNEPKKKAPEDLPLAVARGSLRFSDKTGAAELAMPCMAQTVLASPGFVL